LRFLKKVRAVIAGGEEEEEDEEFEMKPTADFDIDEKDYYKYWKGGF